MTRRRAVFLDRDGVLNHAVMREGMPYPPASVKEVKILAGVAQALQRLKEAGFVLIVVSNQPDVARGTSQQVTIEAINAYLAERLPIDRFIMCYHDESDECDCRKPRPGMLFTGAQEFNIDLARSFMVGDRWRDIEAGQQAGCKTFFVDHGYAEKKPASFNFHVSSLEEATQIILRESIK